MATTLTNIQTDVRFWADNDSLSITSGTNLRIFNQTYQSMFSPDFTMFGVRIGRRWQEATREDTSLTMVVGTEQYNWPTSPDFKEPYFIEGLDTNANNEPYPIPQASSMSEWSFYDDDNNAQPAVHRIIDVAGTLKLALRPKPDQTDGIRITGLIEVTELTQGSDSTIFKNLNADRALAMLVAAQFQAKWGDTSRAVALVQMARGLLPLYDETPRLSGASIIKPWPMLVR